MDYLISGLAIIGLISLAIIAAYFFTSPRYDQRSTDEDDIGNWIDRLRI